MESFKIVRSIKPCRYLALIAPKETALSKPPKLTDVLCKCLILLGIA
jgi:hypothetical protein